MQAHWQFIVVEAINTGQRPIEVQAIWLELSNGNMILAPTLTFTGPLNLPRRLEDGESLKAQFPMQDVADALVYPSNKLVKVTRAVVTDAAGKRYKSPAPDLPSETA
ncbi:MAG: hypothetical protein U0822_19860 [Anaerolineae bacterium]